MGTVSISHVGPIVLLIMLGLYALPSIIAWRRKHRDLTQIIILNLFLGWTLLGWVASLIWAIRPPTNVSIVLPESVRSAGPNDLSSPDDTMDCPRCAERIKKAAKVCRFCGTETTGAATASEPPTSSKLP